MLGGQLSQQKTMMENPNQTDFRQPENESAPDFYDYNFEDLPK